MAYSKDLPKKRPNSKNIPTAKNLIRFLVSKGFTLNAFKSPDDPEEIIFLIKESSNAEKNIGIRIYRPRGAPYLKLTIFGGDAENSKIISMINESGDFIAIKDVQEKNAIGEYYNITVINESACLAQNIQDIINRLRSLLKRVIKG